MTTPEDLSTSLATLVRDSWHALHDDYYHCGCPGSDVDCPAPKPVALVTFDEQSA